MKKTMSIALAAITSLSLLLAMAPPASARADAARVTTQGHCSGQASWKLHVAPENGRLQVEFEVHQATAGDRWAVRIRENGAALWSGSRTVQGDGSFDVKHLARNTSGSDRFVARATNGSTGEVCVGKATF